MHADDAQGAAPRAGEAAGSGIGALFTTDRAVALVVLGALAALVLLRAGFRGALGD